MNERNQPMSDLIARLEKATGPDRQLDNAIWFSLDQPLPDDPAGCPLRYTASLDAALTLVPAGFYWSVLGSDHYGQAWVDKLDGRGTFKSGKSSAGPIIALCIAALKARAA